MNTDPVVFRAILVCRRCRWMQAEVVDSVLSQWSELSVWYMEMFGHTRCGEQISLFALSTIVSY